jgi:hypothetical protein
MDGQDRGVELFSSAPDRLKRRIIEIQNVDATGMRICVHMRANLRATHSQVAHASFQFARCEIRVLHWNSSQAREMFWMITKDGGNVIV